MQSANGVDENIEKIATLFPNCVTESRGADGRLRHSIDFDKLRQELSSDIVEGNEERYEFTWPGKKRAIWLASSPIQATLRPFRGESVDFDNTRNLYIEGDNLDVLKCLKETYLGKVKMIYIDPPYNTGSDFIYKDNFSTSTSNYLANSGQFDNQGNRLVVNPETLGKYHTNWLNMIYPRLKVAKELLSPDGVIFISIADQEVGNLKEICTEIFNENNFLGHIHWRRRHNQPNDRTKMLGLVAEHILAYAKDKEALKKAGVGKIELTANFSNPDNDPRGPWASKPWKVGSDQSGSRYIIKGPDGTIYDEEWMGEESTFNELCKDNRIYFTKDGKGLPRKKYFKYERKEEGQCATNWWTCEQFGHNQGANDCLTDLFGIKNIFSNPKPIELMKGLLQVANVKDSDIVLDFFSGSSSLAHAVIKMNCEDDSHIRFIMVQVDENLDESLKSADSKTKKKLEQAIQFLDSIHKPHTIPEIAKERIRRAAHKIMQENKDKPGIDKLDTGFRVLKLDSTNMQEVYYTPSEVRQEDLFSQMDNVKPDRSSEDLLIQVMLDLGATLDSKIEHEIIGSKEIYNVADGYILACFDKNVTDEVVTAIAKRQPQYAVLRDASLNDDSTVTNFEQIFKTYSPETTTKIL